MLLKSRASLTCFRTCFLPGRAKDLSAPRYKTHQFRSHLHHPLSQHSVATNILPLCSDSVHCPVSSSSPKHLPRTSFPLHVILTTPVSTFFNESLTHRSVQNINYAARYCVIYQHHFLLLRLPLVQIFFLSLSTPAFSMHVIPSERETSSRLELPSGE